MLLFHNDIKKQKAKIQLSPPVDVNLCPAVPASPIDPSTTPVHEYQVGPNFTTRLMNE